MKSSITAVRVKNAMETAEEQKKFSTFVSAVKKAGLERILGGKGPLTVFAPVNEAFEAVPDDRLRKLFRNKRQLTRVLAFHMVAGKLAVGDLMAGLRSARTLEGGTIAINACDGLTIDGAKVIRGDIDCSNGVVHGIDSVLFPGKHQ